MELELILSFLGASIMLTVMPGPDIIYVLTESLTRGQKNGIALSLGLVSGVFVHTLAAAAGISIIIQQSAVAFSVIKYIGAAYLFYLAFMATKEKKANVNLADSKSPALENKYRLVRKGFLMNVTNPKVALFFIALLPQFVAANGFNISLQMIILGLIFALQALIIFTMVAMLSGRLTKYLIESKFWKITKWTKVCVLATLGLALLFARK